MSRNTNRLCAFAYRRPVASVVIVEDDASIRDLAVRALSASGHAVRSAEAGLVGLQATIDHAPDVVVLDLGLPDVDGRDVLKMIRGVSQVPVIIATARDDDDEIVRLLDAGADDYVVKPYSGAQLEARVRAILRRVSAGGQDNIVVGELTIALRSRTVTKNGEALVLNRKEFDLLTFLASHVGEVVSRQDLYAEVWRQPYGGADKTIDVHLSWLRRKLGETAAEPRYLHTVRGVGFKLVEPT